MELIIAALAVYKIVQVINSLLPKEPMPWVKVVAATVVSYGIVIAFQLDDPWITGLAVATVASAVHTLLRLLTLAGDYAQRKSIR